MLLEEAPFWNGFTHVLAQKVVAAINAGRADFDHSFVYDFE